VSLLRRLIGIHLSSILGCSFGRTRFYRQPLSGEVMENGPIDERTEIYQDLHGKQLEIEEENNRHSASTILRLLFEVYTPQSMLDIGCGLGTWLSVAREMGVQDIRGVDGPWLDKSRLRVPEHLVHVQDLEKPFDFQRRFDLVACLEVAEHLGVNAAKSFVASITAHGDVLLFSAAIPFQGGHHHINEQWPDYWRALFGEKGYTPVDFLRARIWNDNSILWWLRQNILLFVNEHALQNNIAFRELSRHASPLSIVHPDVYLSRLKSTEAALEEHKKLLSLLSSGGKFNVKRESNGSITITRSE
jgi:SAM-dependent methyltransferase